MPTGKKDLAEIRRELHDATQLDPHAEQLREDLDLHRVTLMLCTACLLGAGGECYTPGCTLWMGTQPDVPIDTDADGCPIEIPASSMAKLAAVVDA